MDTLTFDLSRATQVLERTPAVLGKLLGGLDADWIQNNYGPETFSPFDVIGHLIHGEKTDWMPRIRMVLKHGELRAFEPFDRYAMFEASRGKDMDRLLMEFAFLRSANLEELRGLRLQPGDLGRTGTHPSLGRVTLRQLLATWVAHDLNHVHQVAKCMAYQYRREVGPWREYLGVLAGALE